MTAIVELERVSRVAPLGVRFRDEAKLAFVSDSLSVVVYPVGAPEQRTAGLPNPSGIFVFQMLPGLRAVEHGEGDAAFWNAQAPRFDFILEVRDRSGSFLPYRLPIRLPQRGVLGIDLTSLPGSPPNVRSGGEALPLFSANTRAVPEGMGVLRAELVDDANQAPAAWALVEASAGEQRPVIGMADAKGRVMLPLLYPAPVVTLGSPSAPNRPLTDQTWPVDVTIRYRRGTPEADIPDLVNVLTQPVAAAWLQTSPPTQWTRGLLRFGRELVPETADRQALPTLHLTPAGSPP